MDWKDVALLLLGSAISLVSSLIMFFLSARHERKKQQEVDTRNDAMKAFHGLSKLMATFNYIENVARHIDHDFNDIERNNGTLEPSALVRTIVGNGASFGLVESDEMSFLYASDGELVARVLEIQERALNIDAAVCAYNELRAEYERFLERHVTSVDGLALSAKIEGKDAMIAELKVGRLNQLLGSLVELLEADRVAAKQVSREFLERASSFYGPVFPAKTLEMREL